MTYTLPLNHMLSAARVLIAAGLALAAVSTPALASYKAKAEEITDYIQAKFYDPEAHLYRPDYPADPEHHPHAYMWDNGIQLTVLDAAAHHEPRKYGKTLKDFAAALHTYWVSDRGVPGFVDYPTPTAGKYYDDNAWIVLGLVEAYETTKDKSYLDWARETQKFCLSGWDDKLGGGIYWFEDHKSKNTCSNAPVAAAAMQLYLVGHDKDQLDWAKRIVDWTTKTFQDTDGLYWDNETMDGHMSETKWTYNSALMIRSYTLLYQATKEGPYLAQARRIADAGLKYWTDPVTGGFTNTAKFNHLFSESLLRLYDVTKDAHYLNAVRRDASFGYKYVRDADGGYHNNWHIRHRPNEAKELIENAAAARLFWLLAPYKDIDELRAEAKEAADKHDLQRAAELTREAAESDVPGIPSGTSEAKPA